MKRGTMHVRRRRGIAHKEVLALAVGSIIAIVILVIIANGRRVRGGHTTNDKDAYQLSQIHRAMTIFARQFDGKFPRPGLINRIGNEPGRGLEDQSLNTTANIFSSMIALSFMSQYVVVSPLERSPKVTVKSKYDFAAYKPLDDVFWDETFAADLEKGSNASYAHMPIVGKQGHNRWRDDLDPSWAMFSFRGPKDGITGTKSYTLQKDGTWAGNVCFADGHIEYLKSTIYIDTETDNKDNLFKDEDGNDMILTFTTQQTAQNTKHSLIRRCEGRGLSIGVI